jgi:Zn-dependent M16 (insulinase) family peptidase
MWGWELFFEELSQHGTANESFSHYALERIEIACGSLESVLHQMRTIVAEGSLNSSESATVTEYCTLLAELIRHLHSTAQEWESYLDQLMQLSQDSSTSYSAPSSTSAGPGRPKFQISRDQLQYLSSMSSFDNASELLYGVNFEDDSIPPDDDPEEAAAGTIILAL